jgi:DNA-binding NtrC family response regulator
MNVLVIDQNQEFADFLVKILSRKGCQLATTASVLEGFDLLKSFPAHVVLFGVEEESLPIETVIGTFQRLYNLPVIVLGPSDVERAVRALKQELLIISQNHLLPLK